MIAIVTPEKIHLSPGTLVHLVGNWTDYQTFLERKGEKPNPRIKYRQGEILLMSPLTKIDRIFRMTGLSCNYENLVNFGLIVIY